MSPVRHLSCLILALGCISQSNGFSRISHGVTQGVRRSGVSLAASRSYAPGRRSNKLTQIKSAASPSTPDMPALRNEDRWIGKLDIDAFRDDIRALGKDLESQQGEADVQHIKKICRWSNICAGLGLLTMWATPNPVTVMALSLWTFSRWTIIAHHTCHGGYNNADKSRFFNSKGFAIGSLTKRVKQWFDWMLPEAWNVEHNNLHHYRLGEEDDPDLVERNLQLIRNLRAPKIAKYAAVAFLMATWKWFYYAPNTYKELKIAEMRRKGEIITDDMGPKDAFTLMYFAMPPGLKKGTKWYSFRDFCAKVVGPYFVGHFLLLPLPILILFGKGAFINAMVNLAIAEVVTNVHAFIAIATNHAGGDLYRFEKSCAPNSGTFYLRQVISSANFRTGGNVNDFMHGWLNYQIEHHLWPQLSALSYQKAQPEVKAICEKHGVPYVQESVWIRLKKTVDIMVGDSSMRPYPSAYENESDLMVWNSNKEQTQAKKGNGKVSIA